MPEEQFIEKVRKVAKAIAKTKIDEMIKYCLEDGGRISSGDYSSFSSVERKLLSASSLVSLGDLGAEYTDKLSQLLKQIYVAYAKGVLNEAEKTLSPEKLAEAIAAGSQAGLLTEVESKEEKERIEKLKNL